MKNKHILAYILIVISLLAIILMHIKIVTSELPTSVSQMHGIMNIVAAVVAFVGSLMLRR